MSVCGCWLCLMCSCDGDTAIEYCRPLEPIPWCAHRWRNWRSMAVSKESELLDEPFIAIKHTSLSLSFLFSFSSWWARCANTLCLACTPHFYWTAFNDIKKHNHKPHILQVELMMCMHNAHGRFEYVCASALKTKTGLIVINYCNICYGKLKPNSGIRRHIKIRTYCSSKYTWECNILHEMYMEEDKSKSLSQLWRHLPTPTSEQIYSTSRSLLCSSKNEFHSITLNMVYSLALNLHVDVSIWKKMDFSRNRNEIKKIFQLLTNYLLVVLLILYLGLIAFSDPLRGTDAVK